MTDILTVEEAGRKWCPLARTVSTGTGNAGGPGGGGNSAVVANRVASDFPLCIGPKCMAWRLSHSPSSTGEERGFCGAFGLPKYT